MHSKSFFPVLISKGWKDLSDLSCKFKSDSGWYLTAASQPTL
jgi:hypothetical protein